VVEKGHYLDVDLDPERFEQGLGGLRYHPRFVIVFLLVERRREPARIPSLGQQLPSTIQVELVGHCYRGVRIEYFSRYGAVGRRGKAGQRFLDDLWIPG